MTLRDVLLQMMEANAAAGQPTDLRTGTVTGVSPLTVTVDGQAAPLQESQLLLTEAVVEKKIPVLEHVHDTSGFSHIHQISSLSHSHSYSGGNTGSALGGSYPTETALGQDTYTSDARLLESQIICQEHGQPLPVENGYIILNRGLAVGDQVVMLRVQGGQRYIILSRVFEVT